MNRVCIFCRQLKDEKEFKLEHVFPAAIGGNFIINSVCSICNEILGKNIDKPLSEFPPILVDRHKFKIARKDNKSGQRNIRNPFAGKKFVGEDGHEYYIQIDENGNPISNIVPKYDKPQLKDDSSIGKLTLPIKDFISEEEAKKWYAKKFKFDIAVIERVVKTKNTPSPLSITINFLSTPLISGALKIAYEFAMTFIPNYSKDPTSLFLCKLLISDNISAEQKRYFEEDESVGEELIKQILNLNGLQYHHYIALITPISEKGLYCIVKIFDYFIAIKLSEKTNYKFSHGLILFNDPTSDLYTINLPLKLSKFSIEIDTVSLNRQQKRIVSRDTGIGATMGKAVPVFDENGILVHKHISELAVKEPSIFFTQEGEQFTYFVEYQKNKYYIKLFKKNILLPIKKVKYIYKLG